MGSADMAIEVLTCCPAKRMPRSLYGEAAGGASPRPESTRKLLYYLLLPFVHFTIPMRNLPQAKLWVALLEESQLQQFKTLKKFVHSFHQNNV